MLTPIRPSLSQALLRQGAAQAPTNAGNDAGADIANPALAARQAFFRQINGQVNGEAQANPVTAAGSRNTPVQTQTPPSRPIPQQIPQQAAHQAPQANAAPRPTAPAVFKAADIARAQAQGETPPPLRPGSLLNIVV